MATNLYFSQGRKSEQDLYEEIIIESLKMYGQDVYYIPREIVNRDRIFEDDSVSRFDNAYRIEMYIENIEGFDGEGDLFTKFGVEIRDAATFIVSRRRFHSTIGRYETTDTKPFFRPREGDLVFLTLSQTFFEITRVETEQPFYQLKDLPVFKMRCEVFEYNDEDFDTGVEAIDNIESIHAQQIVITAPTANITGEFQVPEYVRQINTGYEMRGELVDIDFADSDNMKFYISHNGATDGEYHTWTTTNAIVGDVSGASVTPVTTEEELQDGTQNSDFDTIGDGFIDFSENNPFGDPR
jgi:hypothetical protein